MAGRIGVYLLEGESGCIVEITTIAAISARLNETKDFADRVAKLGYEFLQPSWSRVVAAYPEIEAERMQLCAMLQDRITVVSMARLS